MLITFQLLHTVEFLFYFFLWVNFVCPEVTNTNNFVYFINLSNQFRYEIQTLKLSTTDLLVLASMKNAAKCDT